jgi:dihydroorotase
MSSILIRSVTISDPGGPLHEKTLDLLFQNGRLEKAEKNISGTADSELVAEGYSISPGWVDSYAICGEPGEEWKEDLASLATAGAAGGFTTIAAHCGTHPVSDSAAAIHAIVQRNGALPVTILPIGTATREKNGKEMAEFFDMRNAGAVAVSDGDVPFRDAGLLSRVMEYAANCKMPFLNFAFDPSLSIHGTMHDGVVSNGMGLKGIPTISETTGIATGIQLAKWLKTPLRFIGISAAESVAIISAAKKEGLEIYCAVPVMNLLLTDADLEGFDENCKVLPPLRTETDRQALIKGLKDGTIDAVYSNHQPQDAENKDVEFDYAAFGANNIQVTFGILCEALGAKESAHFIVEKLYSGPMRLLGLTPKHIEVGNELDCTVFSTTGSWVWNASSNKSKSKNSPFLGREICGQVMGTISKGKWNSSINLTKTNK